MRWLRTLWTWLADPPVSEVERLRNENAVLTKTNALLLASMESQARLMDSLKQKVRVAGAQKTLVIADDPYKPSPFWSDEQERDRVRAWWEEMFRDSPAPLPIRDATVPGTDHTGPPAAQAPQDPQDSNGGEEPQVP